MHPHPDHLDWGLRAFGMSNGGATSTLSWGALWAGAQCDFHRRAQRQQPMIERLPVLNQSRLEKCPDMVQVPWAAELCLLTLTRGQTVKREAFLVPCLRFTSDKAKINRPSIPGAWWSVLDENSNKCEIWEDCAKRKVKTPAKSSKSKLLSWKWIQQIDLNNEVQTTMSKHSGLLIMSQAFYNNLICYCLGRQSF